MSSVFMESCPVLTASIHCNAVPFNRLAQAVSVPASPETFGNPSLLLSIFLC